MAAVGIPGRPATDLGLAMERKMQDGRGRTQHVVVTIGRSCSYKRGPVCARCGLSCCAVWRSVSHCIGVAFLTVLRRVGSFPGQLELGAALRQPHAGRLFAEVRHGIESQADAGA